MDIDNIPTASARSQLLLPFAGPYDWTKCFPVGVVKIHPKLMLCMCFTDPSETDNGNHFLS